MKINLSKLVDVARDNGWIVDATVDNVRVCAGTSTVRVEKLGACQECRATGPFGAVMSLMRAIDSCTEGGA